MDNKFLIFLFILLCIAGVLIGKLASTMPLIILAVIVGFFTLLATFQNPENGIYILVFSMMLSPEIVIARVPGREVSIRIDDILVIIVFLTWLTRSAIYKELKGFEKTPIDGYLFYLSLLYLTSTCFGIFFGNIVPIKGFFYALKYLEYFLLYWCVVNIAKKQDFISVYMFCGIITLIIVNLFAYSLMGSVDRVYAPFDEGGGEPASLGGYYLIVFSILFAYLLHSKSINTKLIILCLILFTFPVFIKTLSRASYLAFVPMMFTMFLLTKHNKFIFGICLFLGFMLFPIISPTLYKSMVGRVMVTFNSNYSSSSDVGKLSGQYGLGKQKITDQSALERIMSWKILITKKFTRNIYTMIFGNGVTGIGFVEGQFFVVLGEIGLVGIVLFYGLLIKITSISYKIYKITEDPDSQSLSLALICAVVALVFQSFSTNTFIIVRAMEPFWFLTALVMGIIYSKNYNLLFPSTAS